MIKIFISVRNRLAITKKCIYALKEHSTIKHQIYVYNNETNYRLKEHFEYFYKLYEKRLISQITFTTSGSTFNAFSKASTCNFFGQQHEQDPNKDKYMFLVILDNDIIVTPGWDTKLAKSWKFVNKNKLHHIKVIGQLPGGIKNVTEKYTIGKTLAKAGKLGGSGLWSVRPNFFREVGFLDLKRLVGHNKMHDQLYWNLLERCSGGKPYILGLEEKLAIHCGLKVGSICNVLQHSRSDTLEKIKFKDAEKEIDKLDFKTFYDQVSNNVLLIKDW